MEQQERCKENALLRDRLEVELTETRLKEMFNANKDYLQHICDGKVKSRRHEDFYKSAGTRAALFYTLITDPFTDKQLDWTLREISSHWMRNKTEWMENNDYVWKVLLPETFIKIYMDMFGFNKMEAENRIMETPLRERDRPRLETQLEKEL